MLDEYKQTYIRLKSSDGSWRVSEDLRPRLVRDAEIAGTNMSEFTFELLARAYRVPYSPGGHHAGRKTNPAEGGDVLNLRMPIAIYRAIAKKAADAPRSPQDEILATLAAHYGLKLAPRSSQRRRRRRAADRVAA